MSGHRGPAELVVVGCSAGGVQALQALLGGLDPDFDIPLAITCHIGEQPAEGLRDLLDRSTSLSVRVAAERAQAEPHCVDLAPSGYHLLIEVERRFALSIDPPVHHSRPAIDPLFESAAHACGSRLVGVLLTGGNSDGALGLQCIRRHGGRVLVQDPAEAEVPVMPQAAIDIGAWDFSLPIAGICEWLNRSRRP